MCIVASAWTVNWPAWIEAGSAIAMVGLTWGLVRTARASAEDSRRMANVMAREFETKVAPLVAIEVEDRKSVSGWDHAKVPVAVLNLGSHAVHVLSATLKFWADGGKVHSTPVPNAEGVVIAQSSRRFELTIPLSMIPEDERPSKGSGGKVRYQIQYRAKGATGDVAAGTSDEYSL